MKLKLDKLGALSPFQNKQNPDASCTSNILRNHVHEETWCVAGDDIMKK